MHCPQCGAENDEDNRFCVSCGASLKGQKPAAAPASPRQRVSGLIGTTRRARLITAATVLALGVAIIAFLALKPSDEQGAVPQDAYLRGLDRECTAEKARVSQLETETLQRRPADLEEFASVLVTIAAEWHSGVTASAPSPEHAAAVAGYERALLDLLMRSGSMARVSREGGGAGAVADQAARVEVATGEVEAAIHHLGLSACSRVGVSPHSSG
jgi:hypothetical protein